MPCCESATSSGYISYYSVRLYKHLKKKIMDFDVSRMYPKSSFPLLCVCFLNVNLAVY